jgi:hypothetical protein
VSGWTWANGGLAFSLVGANDAIVCIRLQMRSGHRYRPCNPVAVNPSSLGSCNLRRVSFQNFTTLAV